MYPDHRPHRGKRKGFHRVQTRRQKGAPTVCRGYHSVIFLIADKLNVEQLKTEDKITNFRQSQRDFSTFFNFFFSYRVTEDSHTL